MFGLPQVALGDAVIISVLAVAFLDDLQGLAVQVHRLPVIMLVETYLRVAGQRRSVMGAVLKMTVAVDLQRLRRMQLAADSLSSASSVNARFVCVEATSRSVSASGLDDSSMRRASPSSTSA